MNFFLNNEWKWDDMCGPGGLNPWNDTTKDFGLCFQQLFLQVPVYFIFAIASAYYIGYRMYWVSRDKTQEFSITFRSFTVLALAIVPMINLYVMITSNDYVLHPIDYFSCVTACLTWLVHFVYVLALKHRLGLSPRGPVGLIVLWIMCVVLSVIVLRSRMKEGLPIGFEITMMVLHCLYFLSLLPSSHARPMFYSPCLVGSQHTHSEYTPLLFHIDEDILGTAMEGYNCLSKLIFSWVEPLFQKGLNNTLKHVDDLYEVPAKCSCAYVGARLDRALVGNVDRHQTYQDLPHEPFITSSGYGATSTTSQTPSSPTSRRVLIPPLRRQNVTLFCALHKCFGVQFYSIGILKFISDAAGFAGPMLLSKLVLFVEDETVDLHIGYLYAAAMFGSALIGAVFIAHFNWLMSLIGLKIKGAMVSVILKKILSVSSTQLSKSFSVGEITNFMSTDTDRIVNSCPSFHALWSIPLQLFITLFLMYQQVGLSFLAGLIFGIILIPINKCIANKIGELSTEMMKHKDNRVSLISDMLSGIRTIKLHVWEEFFINKIDGSRKLELDQLRGRKYLDAICVVLWACTPVLLSLIILTVYVTTGGEMRPHIVFTTIALVNMLISPLNAFPWVLNGMTEAWVSIKRIQKLLELPDLDRDRYYDRLDKNRDEDAVIIFKNATFTWAQAAAERPSSKPDKGKGKSKKNLSRGNIQRRDSSSSNERLIPKEPFKLHSLSLRIVSGQMIGVGGPIASGKSSLLHAIIANMEKVDGEIQLQDGLDGFGYVSQKPWLIRGTIRDNILFGRRYDEAKFKSVVDACALTDDLNSLGWNAPVGSSGCTLSGGQRSRIALARAVYQEKQVYLLDDVLSAVDARLSEHILQRCILGLLKYTTRVIVSHNSSILARAHLLLLMKDGQIVRQGPPDLILDEIEEYIPSDSEAMEHAITDETELIDDSDAVSRTSQDDQENASQQSIGWSVVCLYMKAIGWGIGIAILLSLLLMQLSQNFTFLWLSYWIANRPNNSTGVTRTHFIEKSTLLDHSYNALDNTIHTILNASVSMIKNLHPQNYSYITIAPKVYNPTELSIAVSKTDMFYLEVYFGLAGLNLVFTIIRAFLFAYGGVRAASRIHKTLLKVIVKAKVKFFDITPTGRILNRFSSDTYTVDDSLPFIMNILLAQFFSLFGALAVTLYGLPWVFVVLIPLLPFYLWLQRRYRLLSRHLKRLQSVSLSPIYSHLSDTLDGSSTITSSSCTSWWCVNGEQYVEQWQRATLCSSVTSSWLVLRLHCMAAIICGAAGIVAVIQRQLHVADTALIGLSISYALSLTSTLTGVMNAFTETEREMIAVERVAEYIRNVECEKTDGKTPPYGWPTQGVVSFEDVILNYSTRTSSRPALRGVSFSTYPGEKIGIVGRSGAGKSSLCNALLALNSITGQVLVDGVPVHTILLTALRSRIGVIPQEPFIFSGSIRENLDPLEMYNEDDVWRSLERCGARQGVIEFGGLDCQPDGTSRGLKQLLCAARAMLMRPKILVIDEATANVDQETEQAILSTIRDGFAGSTVLMIAHRVSTVMQCDRVIVMDDGMVIEMDQPDTLLDDHNSMFYRMMHAHHMT